jgi:hypothetical protein
MTVVVMVLALHLAHASMRGTITTVDDQGMVTIQTEDGQDHQMQSEGGIFT